MRRSLALLWLLAACGGEPEPAEEADGSSSSDSGTETTSNGGVDMGSDVEPDSAWIHSWGRGSSDIARAVAVDPAGDIYVGGESAVSKPGPIPTTDAVLLKYSADGSLLWGRGWSARRVSPTVPGTAAAALAPFDGGLYAAGALLGADRIEMALWRFDTDGEARWGQALPYLGSGPTVAVTDSARDALLASGSVLWRVGADGEALWGVSLGERDAYTYAITRVVAAPGLGVYIAGNEADRIFVARIDPEGGDLLWYRRFSDEPGASLFGVDIAPGGDSVAALVGWASRGDDTRSGHFALRWGPDGALLEQRFLRHTVPAPTYVTQLDVQSMAVDAEDRLWVAGRVLDDSAVPFLVSLGASVSTWRVRGSAAPTVLGRGLAGAAYLGGFGNLAIAPTAVPSSDVELGSRTGTTDEGPFPELVEVVDPVVTPEADLIELVGTQDDTDLAAGDLLIAQRTAVLDDP